MNRNKASVILLVILLSLGSLPGDSISADSGQADAEPISAPAAGARGDPSAPTVALRAASGATIRFKTQNGEMADGVPPQTGEVAHLVLHRNGALTDPSERTLIVEVTGIEAPPPGVTVTLSIETQHVNPDWTGDSPPRIPLWRGSRWIANDADDLRADAAAIFRLEIGNTVVFGGEPVATPTDYFRYDLLVTHAQRPASNPWHRSSHDYAFLLESQWIAPLPEVEEAAPGAAPDELVVYYGDMFPFRRDSNDAATWLPRAKVGDYIGGELIPAMVEAYRLQTNDWGFPWYQEWTAYRSGDDAERLSVALTDSKTWFHGKAPGQGNAGIAINVSRGQVEYETLTEGLMSTFHHELFHNHQRNIQQHLGGSGQIGGLEGAWNLFTEGTAVLASSVGQPEVQFSQMWGSRAYALNARGFIGWEAISGGDLNKSYEQINAYHGAAYWRFLYEQCGGMVGGVEDPAAGMRVIRQVLTALYSGDIVDVDASTDLVEKMPAILDEALAGASCPFKTYEDSLLAFGGAIFGLRLDGGRCEGPGIPAGCGFYDPRNLYHNPDVQAITYRGAERAYAAADQPYPAGIPSSFGMDLVEVELDTAASGDPLTVEVHGEPGSEAVFAVQLWKLSDQDRTAQTAVAATARHTGLDGPSVYVIPEIDTAEYNRLGLVITRVDAEEGADPEGAYTLVLRPAAR